MIDRIDKLFWKSRQPNKKDGVTLSDIIRGLQYCVNQSKKIASVQYLTEFKEFLDADGKPYKQTVRVGENGAMDVPLICMLNHDALELDAMDVALDITIKNMALKTPEPVSGDSTKDVQNNEVEYLSRTAFMVDLNSANLEGGYTKLGLTLKFKSGSPPEAVSRVIEKLNGQVSAYLLPGIVNNKEDSV